MNRIYFSKEIVWSSYKRLKYECWIGKLIKMIQLITYSLTVNRSFYWKYKLLQNIIRYEDLIWKGQKCWILSDSLFLDIKVKNYM